MRTVIDTNILVSALLTPEGNPASILNYILNGSIVLCYDSRIISEYEEVLKRPKFGFDKKAVKLLLDFILHSGISLVASPLLIDFTDWEDKKFYEVAKSANSYLVTGNKRHYPNEEFVVSPQEFISLFKAYQPST